jgi:hypothetical protein
LSAGIYHYSAHNHALYRLRKGDYRAQIVRATSQEPAIAQAPALFVCTDTPWRNAWKYQEREYRHMGWDSGVILANLLATTAALHLPARLVVGFADDVINQLLDLDTEKEVAASIVALGRAESDVPAAPELAPLSLETTPLSEYEIDYPAIRKVHVASSLKIEEVAGWRGQPPQNPPLLAHGKLFPVD